MMSTGTRASASPFDSVTFFPMGESQPKGIEVPTQLPNTANPLYNYEYYKVVEKVGLGLAGVGVTLSLVTYGIHRLAHSSKGFPLAKKIALLSFLPLLVGIAAGKVTSQHACIFLNNKDYAENKLKERLYPAIYSLGMRRVLLDQELTEIFNFLTSIGVIVSESYSSLLDLPFKEFEKISNSDGKPIPLYKSFADFHGIRYIQDLSENQKIQLVSSYIEAVREALAGEGEIPYPEFLKYLSVGEKKQLMTYYIEEVLLEGNNGLSDSINFKARPLFFEKISKESDVKKILSNLQLLKTDSEKKLIQISEREEELMFNYAYFLISENYNFQKSTLPESKIDLPHLEKIKEVSVLKLIGEVFGIVSHCYVCVEYKIIEIFKLNVQLIFFNRVNEVTKKGHKIPPLDQIKSLLSTIENIPLQYGVDRDQVLEAKKYMYEMLACAFWAELSSAIKGSEESRCFELVSEMEAIKRLFVDKESKAEKEFVPSNDLIDALAKQNQILIDHEVIKEKELLAEKIIAIFPELKSRVNKNQVQVSRENIPSVIQKLDE